MMCSDAVKTQLKSIIKKHNVEKKINICNICIDGNISSGKTTLIEEIYEECKNLKYLNIYIIKEPLDFWTCCGKENHNILQLYENNIIDSGFFQMFISNNVLANQLKQKKEIEERAYENKNIIILYERSYISSWVFFHASYKLKLISKIEYDLLLALTENQISLINDSLLKFDFYFIIKAINIENLIERINARDRLGEKKLSKEYISELEFYYDKFNIFLKDLKIC